MTKSELIKKIEEAGNKYGTFEDVVIIENAYHACIPGQGETWAAKAYRVEGDEISLVNVYWDFSGVENYDEIDDASSLPWDAEEFMSVDDNDQKQEWYDLTDEDDIERAASRIER